MRGSKVRACVCTIEKSSENIGMEVPEVYRNKEASMHAEEQGMMVAMQQ